MSGRVCVGLAILLLSTLGARADQSIEGIAAIVGEDVILRSEVNMATAQMLASIRARQGQVPPEVASQVHNEALRSLIDDKLIMRVAERNNLQASASEIDEAIEGIAADEGISVDDIYTAVSSQGLSRDEYRSQLGTQLTKMRVVSGSVQSRIADHREQLLDLWQPGSRLVGLGLCDRADPLRGRRFHREVKQNMKALFYTGTEETEYRDAPEPDPGPNDALVEVEAVGICGSDMHAWHGHDPRRVPPLILGHEACGIVLEGAEPGARVVINPLIACGACEFCRTGRSNLCAGRELIGMRRPGAFAERVALPARNLIPVPAGMDPAKAALT